MGTTQINFDDWHDRKTVKKGDIGEQLVIDYLSNKGYVVYKSITQGAHPFDNLCASRDKKKIFIVEVKTKEARKYYPDTGIDIRHYNQYKFVQERYNLKVYIFFVDAANKKIYGNSLEELELPKTVGDCKYPWKHKGIIYFPLDNTSFIAGLNDKQAETIKKYSTKKYSGAWQR